MATQNYSVDYEDKRLTQVEDEKQAAVKESDKTFQDMIDATDKVYQDQAKGIEKWSEKQQQLQQEQTDFTIEKIEQEKEQAHKDYVKEQSGAYVDWQKQSNQYGAEAEKMAASGLTNTGYSETSQVSMYNTYQNRVATAREAYQRAELNYNNAIKEAQLQNSSVLAEIAYNAFVQQMELTLTGFQYKNQLITQQAQQKLQIEQLYDNRWQTVLGQLDSEAARRFEEDQATLNREHELAVLNAKTEAEKELLEEQHKKDLALLEKEYSLKNSGSKITGGYSTFGSDLTASISNKTKDDNSGSTTVSSLEQSVSDLGYGPLNEEGLAEKISTGEVIITKDANGNTVAKRNPNYNPITKYGSLSGALKNAWR